MRAVLDALYRGSGVLAALFLVAIALLILAHIVGRLAGVVVPSANEFAGFAMAASTFLALGYTLRANGHIRVSLVMRHLPAGARRTVELWCLGAGAVLIGYFAYFAAEMAWESYVFGDVSPGLMPVPLWIPQAGVALGLIVMAVALVDDAVHVARGGDPSYGAAEAEGTVPPE